MPKIRPLPTLTHPAFHPVRALLADSFVTPSELAERWRYTQSHLANLRRQAKGIPWAQPAGRVLYRTADVIHAELSSTSGPLTSERVCQLISVADHLSVDDRAKLISLFRSFYG